MNSPTKELRTQLLAVAHLLEDNPTLTPTETTVAHQVLDLLQDFAHLLSKNATALDEAPTTTT